MTEISEPKDLFGLPLRDVPSRRGRRKLRFADEVYERVKDLRAGGMSQEGIALALRVSVPTLVKYFGPEMDEALAHRQAELIEMLAKAARTGNVSAIKAYKADIDKQIGASAMRQRERPVVRTPVVRKGKKEERQDAAVSVAQAGGKYAPPPAPRLLVDNT